MKRPNKTVSAKVLGRLEDRAAQYLRKLSPATAFATALEVEAHLAIQWAAEQTEMLRSETVAKCSGSMPIASKECVLLGR